MFEFTLEQSPIEIFWINRDGGFSYVNEQGRKLLGYTLKELQQMTIWDIDPVFTKEQWDQIWNSQPEEQVLENRFESIHRRKDGTEFPVEINSKQIRIGNEIFHVAFVLDITQSKKAYEALQLTHYCLDNAPVAFYRANQEGKLLAANHHLCKSLNYSKKELLNKYVHEVDQNMTQEVWNQRVQDFIPGETKKILSYHLRSDGTSLPVEITTTLLMYGNEKHIIGFATDISERKKAEEELRENEYYLRKSQEIAHIGSYHFKIDDDYWTCSDELNRIFGLDPDLHKTLQTWLNIVHPENQDMMSRYLNDNITNNQRFDKQYRIIRQSDNEIRWVQGYGEFDLDENGVPICMYGTIQDITEQKKAEEEKEKLAAQLRQSQKLESIGRLAGGVAHDFNNMLNVILGYSELIEEQLEPDNPILKEIREINRAGCRARDITRQLLAFSRKQIISPKLINANDCIQTSIKSLFHLIGEHIQLNFFPKQDLWKIKFDPSQLDQILINLSVNARDAMPKGGKLIIETDNATFDEDYCRLNTETTPGHYVLISVSDTGSGISKDSVQKIFEPFYTTKGVGAGTGLGLATVYGIVKQNQGFIHVYSEPEQGANFKIYLPCSDEENIAEAVEDESQDCGKESILLVEDNDLVREMTEKMLESAGYNIVTATDVDDAIRISSDLNVSLDLMLSDVVMPKMHGTDLWEKIKKNRPEIKVLFMSGYTSNVIVHNGVLEDAFSFIQKPFTRNALIKSINEALDKKTH